MASMNITTGLELAALIVIAGLSASALSPPGSPGIRIAGTMPAHKGIGRVRTILEAVKAGGPEFIQQSIDCANGDIVSALPCK